MGRRFCNFPFCFVGFSIGIIVPFDIFILSLFLNIEFNMLVNGSTVILAPYFRNSFGIVSSPFDLLFFNDFSA